MLFRSRTAGYPNTKGCRCSIWQPPSDLVLKLNFNVAIFSNLNYSGVGAIIHNGKGEVMAVMSTKGPPIGGSEEAKILACRRAT